MATFDRFSDILPDPIHRVSISGALDPAGEAGPGFSGLRFSSNRQSQNSRTLSGRGVHRDNSSQYWRFTIQYNPMLRDQFEVVDAFLHSRMSPPNPFFVVLPQYVQPRDPLFAAYANAQPLTVVGNHAAGSSTLLFDGPTDIGTSTTGLPKFGDMLTISDITNDNHKKVYKVTAVEYWDYHQSGVTAPTLKQVRVHLDPPLQRNTADNAVVNFIRPKFRVKTTSDVREYELDTEGLYSYSIDVEEIQA